MGGGGARSFGRSVSLCKTHIFDASLAQVLTPAKGEDTLVRTKGTWSNVTQGLRGARACAR